MTVNILRIRDATRTLGVEQGFLGLPIRDVVIKDVDTGAQYAAMQSAWSIELPDIEKLINGEPLIVQLWGQRHPPILLKVGDDYDPEQQVLTRLRR